MSQPVASAAEIDRWVEQLDAGQFAERQEASRKLAEIGPAAIDALSRAAVGESLEVTVRAIELLTEYLDSADETVQQAAQEALQRIATSERAGASRRAQEALTPPEPATLPRPIAQLGRGAIQIAVAANAGANRIRVHNANGVMTVDVEERDQKMKIVQDPQQGIRMEVTKQQNGQQVTEKYAAKDAAELKKNHPEAYKLYEKYTKAGGNIRFQVQGGAAQQNAGARGVRQGVKAATKLLPAWSRQLEQITSDAAIAQASRAANEQLKKEVADAKQRLAELEGRLNQAINAAQKTEEPE